MINEAFDLALVPQSRFILHAAFRVSSAITRIFAQHASRLSAQHFTQRCSSGEIGRRGILDARNSMALKLGQLAK